jgi:serine/threonine protein kinase
MGARSAVGSVVGGRYELAERIGQGGSGEVFRARDLAEFSREVCVKRLSGRIEGDQARALRDEAQVLGSVRHANVVGLLAVGEEPGGSPFLVLELIRGMTLRALCRAVERSARVTKSGYLPDLVAVHIICAVLRALGAAGRALSGLVHRDVTPHNVLVSREGEVKLGDFGIAIARGRVEWARPASVRGTIGYIAPEQLRGEVLDARADLFAVGVMLYELLTRTRPPADLAAIERGGIAPLATLRPLLARSLADAVDRLVAPRAEDRFPTADDALRVLAPHGAGDLGSLRLAELLRILGTPLAG